MRDHVILGPQPVIDVGSGRCFWRASTHPDPEMAKTGKRQREVGRGGGGGSSKKAGRGSEQTLGGGGAVAGLELPGACVPVFVLAAREMLIALSPGDWGRKRGRARVYGA